MNITALHGVDRDTVKADIAARLKDSRFSIDWMVWWTHMKLLKVRLLTTKEYCGNHPAACEIGNPTHRKSTYLEGADWVEFNDLVNDSLDALGASATVASTRCKVRQGRLRRIYYDLDVNTKRPGQNYEWLKEPEPHHWEDWVGRQAPRSGFPEGTPGHYPAIGYMVEG